MSNEMNENYIRLKKTSLDFKSKKLRGQIETVVDDLNNAAKRLKDLEKNLENDVYPAYLLNNLGILQGRGPSIDVAVAALCEEYDSLKEFKELFSDEDS